MLIVLIVNNHNMKNLISKIKSWFTKPEKKSLKELYKESHPEPVKPIKREGRGAYFHNNRKRTAGRNIQYVQLANGNTRLIRHETI